jgi:uncharacterized surface anchored protein
MRLKSIVVAAIVCALMSMTGAALAQSGTVHKPKVKAQTVTKGDVSGEDTTTLGGTQTTSGATQGSPVLPFTGADITLFVLIGVGAIVAGAILVRRTRAEV